MHFKSKRVQSSLNALAHQQTRGVALSRQRLRLPTDAPLRVCAICHRPHQALGVAERLVSLCSALSSSPTADASSALTCFWPALRAAQHALRESRDAALQPGTAEADDAEGRGRLGAIAALLARLFAVLAVRRRSLPGDGAQLLAAAHRDSNMSASKAGVEGGPWGFGGPATAAGFIEDGERLLATTVLMRAELRLAQLSSNRRAQQQGGSIGTAAASGWSSFGEAPAANSTAVVAAAEDARTLLEQRAAAALTQLLIEEPVPLASRDEAARTLWLTLHSAIAHLRLQGMKPAACFRVRSTRNAMYMVTQFRETHIWHPRYVNVYNQPKAFLLIQPWP